MAPSLDYFYLEELIMGYFKPTSKRVSLLSLMVIAASCSFKNVSESSKNNEKVTGIRSDKNISGCIAVLNNSPTQAPVKQRLEVLTDWDDAKFVHESKGSAKFKFQDKMFDVEGSFTYKTIKKVDPKNRRFESGESEIIFSVNGVSGRSTIGTHMNLDSYRDGVFFPSKDGTKLEFMAWGKAVTSGFLDIENPKFYLFVMCTPRSSVGMLDRSDTVYLK